MPQFADQAQSITAEIVSNDDMARNTKRLRFRAGELASSVVPGQFFMVRLPNCNDPLIGRAFALWDIVSNSSETMIDVVYLVKGKLTTALAPLGPGDRVAVWGPLGNGFAPVDCDHLVMVAGGVGQTPFLALAREALGQQSYGSDTTFARRSGYAGRVTMCYGARTADYLAGLDDFRAAGIDLQLATEDGSLGLHGRVTQVLENVLDASDGKVAIVCCGPEPMMAAVAKIAAARKVGCQVSLETPMACGIGICFTCVAKVGTEAEWDYKRTCVEGPVFDSQCIRWD